MIYLPNDKSFKIATSKKDLNKANEVFYCGLTWVKDFFMECYSKEAIDNMIKNQEIFVKGVN